MARVLTVHALRNRRFNQDNVNQFTAQELRNKCSNANLCLREYCQNMGFDEYPYIVTSRATPQEMRGWLLYHFPDQYHVGKVEVGMYAGHRVNRGIKYTADGNFSDVAGMRRF